MEHLDMTGIKTARDYSGKLITFEGCEGCGKTTQSEMLREYLLGNGRDVLLVHEPGGTPLGDRIREMLLDPSLGDIKPISEALLFAADRVQLVNEVILPFLKRGGVVICDRFIDSSLAYQGVGRGCGLEAVKNLNDWACGNIDPDVTVFLDLKVKEGLRRAAVDQGLDRIESESLEFHENVRHAYSMLIRIFSHRYIVVDGNGSQQEVHARLVDQVNRVIS